MDSATQRRIAAILLIIGGVIAIILPFASATLLTVALGGVAFAAGIGQMLRLGGEADVKGKTFRALTGLLYIGGAIWILLYPINSEVSLTLFAGILLLIEGIMELAGGAASSTPAKGMLVVDGVITAILGLLLVVEWPSDSIWALGTIFGATMFLSAFNLFKSPA